MKTVPPLNIRIAIIAHTFVSKEELRIPLFTKKPIIPFRGDERIVSLYSKSLKPQIKQPNSKLAYLIRKSEYGLVHILKLLKSLIETDKPLQPTQEIAPLKHLLVPQLPHPPFCTSKPSRFFWHPAYSPSKDEYAPSCLISETKEAVASTVFNSPYICTYARCTLSQKGILRQDQDGFIYLQLSNTYITELMPLIPDEKSQAISFNQPEPSIAHIPVILPHEAKEKKGWVDTQDLKKTFSFKINKLCSIRPLQWPGIEKVYFLSISSPELERFRERCLLPSLIRGHEFHIAIAYNKKMQGAESPTQKETFRLNVSCFAA